MQHDDKEMEREVASQVRDAKARADLIAAGFLDAAATPQGRAMLWWMLELGRFGQQPFRDSDRLTAFACGELNVGQQLFAKIEAVAPGTYLQMVKDQPQ